MDFHAASELFPRMSETELSSLAADIEENGQREAIYTCEGKILDGRHRFLACIQAEVEPWFEEVETDDPWQFSLSKNLKRRHLTESQRAMVAARIRAHYELEAKGRQGTRTDIPENLPVSRSDSRDAAGSAVGVSGKSVDHATRVVKHGAKALVDAVNSGEVAVSAAAKLAELPKSEQAEVIKEARRDNVNVKAAVNKAVSNKAKSEDGGNSSVVLDALERPVPQGFREAHSLGAAIQALSRSLNRVKSELADFGVQPGGAALNVGRLHASIDSLKADISSAVYWCECPRCNGAVSCANCSNRGWLSKWDSRHLTAEDKTRLGVE